MRPKKEVPQKIRPFAGDMLTARKIAEITGLPIMEVLNQALSAGLKAIKDNGYVLPLPLNMQVIESLKTDDRISPLDEYPLGAQEEMIIQERPESTKKKKAKK